MIIYNFTITKKRGPPQLKCKFFKNQFNIVESRNNFKKTGRNLKSQMSKKKKL